MFLMVTENLIMCNQKSNDVLNTGDFLKYFVSVIYSLSFFLLQKKIVKSIIHCLQKSSFRGMKWTIFLIKLKQ
jgi:hypothetical protein